MACWVPKGSVEADHQVDEPLLLAELRLGAKRVERDLGLAGLAGGEGSGDQRRAVPGESCHVADALHESLGGLEGHVEAVACEQLFPAVREDLAVNSAAGHLLEQVPAPTGNLRQRRGRRPSGDLAGGAQLQAGEPEGSIQTLRRCLNSSRSST